ncbi:MAG: acyl-CoA dehydrogenase, partial [Alphaproteobacteria bacterium]
MDGTSPRNVFGTPPGARAAAIAPVIAEHADAIERDRRLTPEVLDALHGQALFRMLLPKPYGGEEATPEAFRQAIESLARQDASTAWCVCQAN